MKKLMFAMAVVAAGAASAVSFSYQGALKTAEGGPIPANQSNKVITFKLYDTPTGEDALWGREIAVHLDTNGLFNVDLSDTAGSEAKGVKTNDLAWVLSEKAGEDNSLYIGLKVEGSTGEIRPRQKLLHVPSAAFAANVRTAKRDFTVEGTATFNGTVNAQNGLTVDGGKLTAEKGLTVSAGGLTVTKGGLTVTAGELKASGGLTVSGAALTVDKGLNVSGGALAFPGGGGIIPKGGIIMWSGATPPDGWAICNGENNTPDLRGRFIVGYDPHDTDYNDTKKTGGKKKVELTAAETPLREHLHTYWGNDGQKLSHDSHLPPNNIDKGFWSRQLEGYISADTLKEGAWRYETSKESNNAVAEHENRPPYYVLAFIMKL